MKEVTLCFPLVNREPPIVLLGLKKRGFGQGKVVGFGGKIEAGETVEEAAVREMEEETGLQVAVKDLEPAGQLRFYFPTRPEWDHLVHVYRIGHWQGEPQETAEMQPQWFAIDAIPYAAMWDDARSWLPFVLSGQAIDGVFWYNDDLVTVATMELMLKAVEASKPQT